MEDMQEVQETSVEVQDLFAQAAESAIGSVDMEDELEQLEQQMLEEELLKTQAVPSGPTAAGAAKVPTEAIPSASGVVTPATTASVPSAAGGNLNADEEAQLAELQAQLNFA